jgi:hypothetical protein
MQENLKITQKINQKTGKENTENCQVCAGEIILTEGKWREDDDGILYCLECWDEIESCNCSD